MGSQKWLQMLVNERPGLLNDQIAGRLSVSADQVRWLSPLREQRYLEYRDDEFVNQLGISLVNRPLSSFWPRRGPSWDALGKCEHGQILLVEAKSHAEELVSTMEAKNPSSIKQIRSSLEETKQFIGTASALGVDWTTGVYQYANRLAHLYLMHRLNGLDTYLVLLYFLNDTEMAKPRTHVPATPSEWEAVIKYQDRLMGIRERHPLSDRIFHVFIDTGDIDPRA